MSKIKLNPIDAATAWSWVYSGREYFTGVFPDSGRTYTDSGARPPQYTAERYRKCPFCGNRQDVKEDGPMCKKCGGDVMHEGVK